MTIKLACVLFYLIYVQGNTFVDSSPFDHHLDLASLPDAPVYRWQLSPDQADPRQPTRQFHEAPQPWLTKRRGVKYLKSKTLEEAVRQLRYLCYSCAEVWDSCDPTIVCNHYEAMLVAKKRKNDPRRFARK